MKVFLIFLLLVLGACHSAVLAGDVAGLLERTEREAEHITLPTNTFQDEGIKAAQETAKLFHSPEFQERIRCEEQRLEKEIFAGYTAPWEEQQKEVMQRQEHSSLAPEEKVYLLFSSSVPIETMQAHIAAIAGAGDAKVVMAMRGWVNGLNNSGANIQYFSRILQKDPLCRGERQPCEHYQVPIKLQPTLFATYDVTQVPAVIYVNGDTAYRMQGDAALDYMLERINSEVKSTTLDKLITTLRNR